MLKNPQKGPPRSLLTNKAQPSQLRSRFTQDGIDRPVAGICDNSPLMPLAIDDDGWLVAWRRRLEAAKLAALDNHAVSKSEPPETVNGIEMVSDQEAAVATVLLTANNVRFLEENEQKPNHGIATEQGQAGACDEALFEAVASMLSAFGFATDGPPPKQFMAIMTEMTAAIDKVAAELGLTTEELHGGLSNLVSEVERHAPQIVTMLFVRSLLPLIGAPRLPVLPPHPRRTRTRGDGPEPNHRRENPRCVDRKVASGQRRCLGHDHLQPRLRRPLPES